MPSRVVHVRLDDWVILGCHDILKIGGLPIENLPVATMIRQVLGAFIRKMQQLDKIKIYTDEERYQRLQELYQVEGLILEGLGLEDVDISSLDLAQTPERAEDRDISGIVSEAIRKIEMQDEPNIKEEVKLTDVEEIEDEDIITIDIMTQECTAFDVLAKRAPKDRFIEWAIKEDNKIIKQAVAIAYTGLPQAMWGTDKAEGIISGLFERHRGNSGKTE